MKYNTKLIEFTVTFGQFHSCIRALVIPKINVSLKLPGLSKLAEKFVSKKYKLADQELLSSDNITNINLILGAESAFCLPSREVVFGQ